MKIFTNKKVSRTIEWEHIVKNAKSIVTYAHKQEYKKKPPYDLGFATLVIFSSKEKERES